jgi:broad specificity phosphatase PhoE
MRKMFVFVLPALLLIAQPHAQAHKPKSGDSSDNSASGAASSFPRLIMIVRHGEKPGDGSKENKDPNLSSRGYERAAALAHVIPDNFARPDYLFATHKSSHSMRPIETITPLSKSLHEPIEESFKDDEFAAVAHKILGDAKYANRVVLISWHHGKIPELAHALGATEAPEKWNSAVFDRVWEITYKDGKASFADLPQKALPGDSDK